MKNKDSSELIGEVSSFISKSGQGELPAEVMLKAKHIILDTLAAMVSGSRLKPGILAKQYIEAQGGVEEAQIAGSALVTSAMNAAFANGMMAHADETDDSYPEVGMHPACSLVPAALAASEKVGRDGIGLVRGVVVGYDIGCRIARALSVDYLRKAFRSPISIGGIFGAAAAAASVLHLNTQQVKYALSYTAQQASGVSYWVRDEEHVQKAFVFGGMPARNGILSAILAQSGFTGAPDPFIGERNFFDAFSPESRPEILADGLGSHYEIMGTNIKKFPVGGPIQPALESLFKLIGKYRLTAGNVQNIVVKLSGDGTATVNNRSMPDINLKYILAVTLIDGRLTFETAHSYERMKAAEVLEMMNRIELRQIPELAVNKKANRQAVVQVITRDGASFVECVGKVRGTAENPMTTDEVQKKCPELLIPVLGEVRSEKLIDRIWHLEEVSNVCELRPLLSQVED